MATVWKIPIPGIDETIAIETEDTTRDPVEYIEFVGHSSLVHVVGEHDLEVIDRGTRLNNRFTVDGEAPGVEQYFEQKLDEEFDNLETALRSDIDTGSYCRSEIRSSRFSLNRLPSLGSVTENAHILLTDSIISE